MNLEQVLDNMAIDTNNKKLSLITFHQIWNTPLNLPSDGIGSDDQKHLIAEYCGLTWTGVVADYMKKQARSIHRFVFCRIFGRIN